MSCLGRRHRSAGRLDLLLDLLLALLVVTSTVFALIGPWGQAKLSDFFKRLHGPTQAATLGVGCVLIASGLWLSIARGAPSLHGLHELLITLFLFLTATVSAHLLIKAALRVASPAERPFVPPLLPLPTLPSAGGGAAKAPSAPSSRVETPP